MGQNVTDLILLDCTVHRRLSLTDSKPNPISKVHSYVNKVVLGSTYCDEAKPNENKNEEFEGTAADRPSWFCRR